MAQDEKTNRCVSCAGSTTLSQWLWLHQRPQTDNRVHRSPQGLKVITNHPKEPHFVGHNSLTPQKKQSRSLVELGFFDCFITFANLIPRSSSYDIYLRLQMTIDPPTKKNHHRPTDPLLLSQPPTLQAAESLTGLTTGSPVAPNLSAGGFRVDPKCSKRRGFQV